MRNRLGPAGLNVWWTWKRVPELKELIAGVEENYSGSYSIVSDRGKILHARPTKRVLAQ